LTNLGRLRWRCRRGMKELDVLLTRYVDERYAAAPAAEQRQFECLLEAQDPVIYAYCMGQTPIPVHLESLISLITAGRADAGRADAGRADP
jgi:antitoxin CptB